MTASGSKLQIKVQIYAASNRPQNFAQSSLYPVPTCLQTSARDAEKLPNKVHIGCYTINTQPVKAAIERQMRELREELLASLRRKVMPQFFQHAHPIMHHTQLSPIAA